MAQVSLERFLFAFSLHSAKMGKKGGIRKRILEPEGGHEPAEPKPTQLGSSSTSRSIRRRLEVSAPSSSSAPSGPLVPKLVRDWAKGKLTALQVQDYALGASDKSGHNLEPVAGAGSYGKNPQNVHRSLVQLFGRPLGCPEMKWFTFQPSKAWSPIHSTCHICGSVHWQPINLSCSSRLCKGSEEGVHISGST